MTDQIFPSRKTILTIIRQKKLQKTDSKQS